MVDGVRIINDAGTILIDAERPTFVMERKGSGRLNNGYMFVESPGFHMAIRSAETASAIWLAGIDGARDGWHIRGVNDASVSWYIFRPISRASDSGFCLFDSRGRVTFDAMQKTLRVDGVRKGNSRNDWSGSVTYTAGRLYAIMNLVMAMDYEERFRRLDNGDYEQHSSYTVSGGSVSGARVSFTMGPTLTMTYGPYSGAMPTAYAWGVNRARIAVVDVSNY